MFKINKLEQFIKKSNPLYWAVKDEYNYIANEFSIMKIKDLLEQINFRLLTLFKEVPETALRYDSFGVAKDDAIFKLLENIESADIVPAIDTELVWATVEVGSGKNKSKGVRIFKAENKTVYIPAETVELLSDYDDLVYGNRWLQFKKDNEWFLKMETVVAQKNEFIK